MRQLLIHTRFCQISSWVLITLLLSVGVAQAESGTDSLKVISPTYGLLSINMVPSTEPIAQMPLSEFKQLIVRVDKLQQREKLQAELIGHLQEKDRVHTDYIAKMEAADEQRERYVEKLEQINNQLAAENKDKQLSTLAEGAGYGATAAAVIGVVVRKFILKF